MKKSILSAFIVTMSLSLQVQATDADKVVESCKISGDGSFTTIQIIEKDMGSGTKWEVGSIVTPIRTSGLYLDLLRANSQAAKTGFKKLNNSTGAVSFAKNYLQSAMNENANAAKVEFKKVASMSVVALNNEGNIESATGASIITLRDKQNKVIYRIGQVGHAIGACE